MSDIEFLAVELFGFAPKDKSQEYTHQYQCGMVFSDGVPRYSNESFPDFTHPQLRYYWIAQMEAKLAERGLLCAYTTELDEETSNMDWITFVEAERPFYLGKQIGVIVGYKIRALLAIPEQRLAAAVRVLEEAKNG